MWGKTRRTGEEGDDFIPEFAAKDRDSGWLSSTVSAGIAEDTNPDRDTAFPINRRS